MRAREEYRYNRLTWAEMNKAIGEATNSPAEGAEKSATVAEQPDTQQV